uniref:PHD-type domain-containing protein n=1 Tax=Timema shepardi TaxID=629360 RepID=A0A7R9B435_TIMSH|nr:unnamed protein product [Timema shepardi]
MGEEGDKTLKKTLKKNKVTLISQTLHGVAKMKKKPGRKSLSHTLNELARKRKMKNVRKSKQQTLGNSATMTIGIQKRQIPHSPENVIRTNMKKGTTPILRNIAGRKTKTAKTTPQMPRKGVLMNKAEKVASIRMKARRVALIKTTRGLSAGKELKSVVSDVSISDNVEHIKEENSYCKKEDGDTKIDNGDIPLSHDLKSPPSELDNGSKFLRNTADGLTSQVGKGYIPRSTRSQNPKFVEKQRSFLKKVHSMVNEDLDEESESDTKEESKEPLVTNSKLEDAPKTIGDASPGLVEPNYDEDMAELRRRSLRKEITMVGRKDKFCWKCHKQEKEVLSCELCPRSYHLKCVLLRERPREAWVCPECVLVTHADDEASRSTNMRMVTSKEQRKILHNVVKMMKEVKLVSSY